MNKIPSISDAFKTIVAATEAAIIADTELDWGTLPKKVYFLHGHLLEIQNVLQAYTNSPDFGDKKYPLIILVRDIDNERPVAGQYGFDLEFDCRIFICTLTSAELRADDRETKNFKPVLHPILFNFMDQIILSERFNGTKVEDYRMSFTDRYYWGANIENKNIFCDLIDAVEIPKMSLKLYNEHCAFTNNF